MFSTGKGFEPGEVNSAKRIRVEKSDAVVAYDAWSQSATYAIKYRIDLAKLPRQEQISLWVPKPVNNHNQHVLSASVAPSGLGWQRQDIQDNRGNEIIEFVLPADSDRIDTLTFSYIVQRHPARGLSLARFTETDRPEHYLAGSAKVPVDGLIESIALQQKQIAMQRKDAADAKRVLQRAYYDYVFDTMTYSKEGKGWGEGDALWACQSKYGNCTDFHSLYIGLARSQDIPARFKIGFPLSALQESGRHDGYHCWAEVFDDKNGWLPLDASEAKGKNLREKYFGRLPSNRIEFSQGRDIILSARQRGEPVNYFIYPYAETADLVIERLPVAFSYLRLESQAVY
ncbi:MAG: transglutaminase domain-containing protein [Pseudomonadales bacterium]|nr:transglutaminase domain-containing protein [Pseudomonadales bacterium]